MKSWPLCFLISWLLVSCRVPGVQRSIVEPQPMPAPAGFYADVAWLDAQTLVVWYEAEPLRGQDHLALLTVDGRELKPLQLPAGPQRCITDRFSRPERTPDGQLAFLHDCAQPRHPILENVGAHLWQWDPASGQARLLRPYKIDARAASKYALAPDLSTALLTTNVGIQDDLFWLDRERPERFEAGFVRAQSVAWSPDGSSIVLLGDRRRPFFAPGPLTVDAKYSLWLMPANCREQATGCDRQLERLVRVVDDPTAVTWSPDSQWIAWDGALPGRGYGIWLRNMRSGKTLQILEGPYRMPRWSPDGQQLIVLGPVDNPEGLVNPEEYSQPYLLDFTPFLSE